MKKNGVLITGAEGFVAPHLVRELRRVGYTGIHGAHFLPLNEDNEALFDSTLKLDVTDYSGVHKALESLQPNYIVHLAAQSSVGVSWGSPLSTIAVNVMGSLNIMEACRLLDLESKLLLIGSSEEYGQVSAEDLPLKETHSSDPLSPYAVSKHTVCDLGRIYGESYGLHVVMTRSFNHIGPGQDERFAIPSFCRRMLDLNGGPGTLEVGNITVRRDFTDVRDVVRAYVMLLEKGRSSEIYNVGSGHAVALSEVIETIGRVSSTDFTVAVNPEWIRSGEIPETRADTGKIRGETGWEPAYQLQQSISDILDSMR